MMSPRDALLPTLLLLMTTTASPALAQGPAGWPASELPAASATRFAVDASGEASRGASDPLVTIVTFSDFECPFCGRTLPTLERLFTEHEGELRVVFRQQPLPFHRHARPAAEASLEALAQGGSEKFWEMHDLLFENQRALTMADLSRYASELGLDVPRFRRALEDHRHTEAIDADLERASHLQSRGTPAFFVNGRLIRGAQPYAVFAAVVAEELAFVREGIARGVSRSELYARLQRGAEAHLPSPRPRAAAPAAPPQRVHIPVPSGAPSRGAADAPLVLQIFSDFQCPFCSRVTPTLDRVLRDYEGRVRLVWRNFPLPFHARARPAANAALEVFAQRGGEAFWRYHDLVFENQRSLGTEELLYYASLVPDVDLDRLREAIAEGRHDASIDADMRAVQRSGARIGTPAVFIGERLVMGAQPYAVFREAIDAELTRLERR